MRSPYQTKDQTFRDGHFSPGSQTTNNYVKITQPNVSIEFINAEMQNLDYDDLKE